MAESFPSILCADDDVDVLERLKEYFTLQGFIVLTASNGVEACLQVKRWAPRAVILDLFIPRLGGIGALGRIHAIDPTLPVILTTDTGEGLAMATGAGLAVTGTFAKPLDLECISKALARAGVTPPAEPAADDTGAGAHRPAPRVLVVDDEGEFREVLIEYLGSKGFEAREAGSGEEAVEQVAAFDPHIVLLDLMMAGMGGLEALREIKTIAPRACVIMVTAAHDLDAARGALTRGAADYVTKPFPFRYLDAVLDVHLPLDGDLARA
jgi:DNA-binding response OmpR family regulator